MERWYAIFARLLLVQLVLAVLFLASELGARLWLGAASEASFLKYASIDQLGEDVSPGADQRFAPHRYLGYFPAPGWSRGGTRHDALGYRGPGFPRAKPEGEYRIVCIGGSTTYTTSVEDDAQTYPAWLQAELRQRGFGKVRVINAGCGAWTSWESLVNLEMRVLDLDPDMVIVYHDINDVHPRIVWPREAYRGDNSGFRADTVPEPFEPSIWESSTLLRILMVNAGAVQPHSWEVTARQPVDRRSPTSYDEEFRKQYAEGSYPSSPFEDTSAMQMLDANPPVFFRRNLESMVAVARQHGVTPVLATFASDPSFATQAQVASAEYRRALEEGNQIVRRVARDGGAHLFDFARAFPKGKRVFTDGRHVTPEGAALKGELFARYLIQNDLLPDSARS